MTSQIFESITVQTLLDRVAGLESTEGDARAKFIVRQLVSDLFGLIERFDVSPAEFWQALNFLQSAAPELGLIAPGLGFDRFLDIRMDAAEEARGAAGGTPRTIEGPLYIPGAPRTRGVARLDDGTDDGVPLIMHGTVRDTDGRPVAGAVVDVWHANSMGNYSGFDPAQSPYNNRRQIETGSDGGYRFRTILPAGYAVPPGGSTDALLQLIGRHGRRPAHIHFFVSAPGHRHLTTQINIDGDPDLHDDFAYATRDELIPPVDLRHDPEEIAANGLDRPFAVILFDFVLAPAKSAEEAMLSPRPRAAAMS